MSDDDTIRNDDDLRRARNDLDFRIDDYLRRCGWGRTSDTPGCYVLWEREHNGRRLLVDTKLALSMQSHIEDSEVLDEPPAGEGEVKRGQ